jgi:hypothetical protein
MEARLKTRSRRFKARTDLSRKDPPLSHRDRLKSPPPGLRHDPPIPDDAKLVFALAVCSSFYRVRRTVKKVQSPKVVLGRPHKPCHKLSLKAALGGSCSPTSYGPNRAAPPKVSTCIYDRPGPWGGDSIEPKIKEGEEGPENRPCSLPLKQSRWTGR